MNKKIIFLFLLFQSFAYSQEKWRSLGPDDFNQASYSQDMFSKTIVKNNYLYQFNLENTYIYNDHYFRLNITRYDGYRWEQFAKPFNIFFNSDYSYYYKYDMDAAIDNDNVPYVFFNDTPGTNNGVVKKYNGTDWELVGGSSISAGVASGCQIAVGSDNNPYIIYSDSADSALKGVVKKFNGTNWISIGTNGLELANPVSLRISLDNFDVPYVCYSYYLSSISNYSLMVKKFDGTNWVEVGITDFATSSSESATTVLTSQLSFDHNNTPYLTYDHNQGHLVKLKKFTGTNWIDLPAIPTTISSEQYVGTYDGFIAFDSSNMPYIICKRPSNYVTYVFRLQGSNWEYISYVVDHWKHPQISFLNNTLYATSIYSAVGISASPYASVSRLNGSIFQRTGDISLYANSSIHNFTLSNNLPVVAYSNNNHQLSVSMLNTTTWFTIGQTNISDNYVFDTKIETANNGTVYLGYLSKDNSTSNPKKITVKKLTVNGWDLVGNADFSLDTGSEYLDMKINHANIPYVVYGAGRVQKYNGTSWEFVGSGSFGVSNTSELAFDNNDTPYVIYNDAFNNSYVTVRKFDGTSWVYVGQNSLLTTGQFPTIKFDSNNIPYIAYVDYSKRTHVKYFNGTDWLAVGTETLASQDVYDVSLAIDAENTPSVAFSEVINSFFPMITVQQFDGSNWQVIGHEAFSAGGTINSKLKFSSNNKPVVIYQSYNGGIYAKYFGELNALGVDDINLENQTNIVLYPNPIKDIFIIESKETIDEIMIYDMLGKKVFSQKNITSNNINIAQLPNGFYIVKAKTENGVSSLKIMKQ